MLVSFGFVGGGGAGDNWGWLMGAWCRCGRERWG